MSTQQLAERTSRPPPNRRRDKPQLSCNLCRRRKLRCDRQHPCGNCKRRELGPTCTYVNGLPPAAPPIAIHDRLRHLEDLVVSYIGSDNAPLPRTSPCRELQDESPVSSDFGSLKRSSTETKYQDQTHWHSILDAITELKGDVAEAGDPKPPRTNLDTPSSPTRNAPLLYGGCRPASREEILAAIPSKTVVDALVLDYFEVFNLTSCALHKIEFLKQCDSLWKEPHKVPIMWLGLLFAVLSVSLQLNYESIGGLYREKAAQCLLFGQYTKCGPHVIETLLRDTSNETWLLTTAIVHLAMRMGYHRDPEHYKNLSPYEGEMRRRVWAMLYQLGSANLSMSSLLGVPRLINDSFVDTAFPRNLLDSDFDASSTELPPSRANDDPTPMTIILSKIRLGRIHDTVTSATPAPYGQILHVDRQVEEKFSEIPGYCKMQSQPESNNDPPVIILQRLMINMSYHKAQIMLHWRYLALAKKEPRYMYSKKVAVSAALAILDLNHTMYEGLKTGGRLFSVRWRVNNILNNDFFLATSVLCFYLHLYRDMISTEELNNTMQCIRATKNMWDLRTPSFPEAQRAATAIRSVFPEIIDFNSEKDACESWTCVPTNTSGHLAMASDQDPLVGAASMPFFDSLFDVATIYPPRTDDPESLIGSFLTGNTDPWLQEIVRNKC
ncbi:hypothetical protein F5Y16DRAFT_407151 [Xylariaceae sp. FL0255]|nr:hypothetical protein F5Y16DRAFT_407151 [Xylariaceae sp. FL0255]